MVVLVEVEVGVATGETETTVLVSTCILPCPFTIKLTSRSTPVGDNAGVAAAGLLGLSTSTVEGRVLVVVTVFVGHGRTHQGGGGQESSLHLRYRESTLNNFRIAIERWLSPFRFSLS